MASVENVAKRFTEQLIKTIGKRDWAKVVRRNATEATHDVCHSHDFCDANQVMLDVFAEFKIDSFTDAGGTLWNEAWTIAKASWQKRGTS